MCVKFCMSRENLCGIFWGCMENPDFGAMWNFAAKPGFFFLAVPGLRKKPIRSLPLPHLGGVTREFSLLAPMSKAVAQECF